MSIDTLVADQPACRADEAERCLLGQCMTWPKPCLDEAAKHVDPADFFDPALQRLYGILLGLDDETGGRGFDSVMVEATLRREGALESVGGHEALVALANAATNQVTAEFHARQVRKASLGRQLQEAAHDVLRATAAKDFEAERVLGTLTKRLAKLDAAAGEPEGATTPVLVCMGDVKAVPVAWLWRFRIALGRITLLVGRPGAGKGFVGTDIAARISTGTPFPDGSACPTGSTILISAEDDPGDVLRPRLNAVRADAHKVHLLSAVRHKGDGHEVMFTLRDLDALEAALKIHRDCKLVVVDPIGSFLGGKTDAHRDNEVRAVVAPAAMLVAKYGPAMLVIAHRRKSTADFADDLALGSRAFTGLARTVWHLTRDPENKGRRLLLGGKNNLGPETDGLAFSIVGDPPSLAWEREPVRMRADDALATENEGQKRGPKPEDRREAEAWLADFLAGGPRLADECLAQAARVGISTTTLRRAKAAAGVVARKQGLQGPWVWSLNSEGDQVVPE